MFDQNSNLRTKGQKNDENSAAALYTLPSLAAWQLANMETQDDF